MKQKKGVFQIIDIVRYALKMGVTYMCVCSLFQVIVHISTDMYVCE